MIQKYLNRIPKGIDLGIVCDNICKDFSLGNFIDFKIVLNGYEDLNVILTASENQFFVKIFKKTRTEKECVILTDINLQMIANGVNCAKLYPYGKDKYLYHYEQDDSDIFLIVQEFIRGENFYLRNSTPNDDEIAMIIRQISKIQKIKDVKKEYIYDSWYLGNIKEEFEIKKGVLLRNETTILLKIIAIFDRIDFDELPKSFIHGDLTKENVIKDENGKIWFIDFSVSNIYPRILELVIINTHLIIDYADPGKTYANRNLAVREYEKYFDLAPLEKNSLADLELIAYGIEYLTSIYELRKAKNDSDENMFYIRSSIRGLLESRILDDEETIFLNTLRDDLKSR
jgi:Ser/Thr protein kinase RdoA (MazF antagonist)